MKRPASRNRGAIRRILTRGAEFFYPSFANHDAMRLTFIQIFNLLRALIVSLDIFLARLEAHCGLLCDIERYTALKGELINPRGEAWRYDGILGRNSDHRGVVGASSRPSDYDLPLAPRRTNTGLPRRQCVAIQPRGDRNMGARASRSNRRKIPAQTQSQRPQGAKVAAKLFSARLLFCHPQRSRAVMLRSDLTKGKKDGATWTPSKAKPRDIADLHQ